MHSIRGPGSAAPQQPPSVRTTRAVTPSKRNIIDLDDFDDDERPINGDGLTQEQNHTSSSKRVRSNNSNGGGGGGGGGGASGSSGGGRASWGLPHQTKGSGDQDKHQKLAQQLPATAVGGSDTDASVTKSVTTDMASMSMSAVQKGKRPEFSDATSPSGSPAARGQAQPRPVVGGIPRSGGFHPQTGARKLVIKNLRTTPTSSSQQQQSRQNQPQSAAAPSTTATGASSSSTWDQDPGLMPPPDLFSSPGGTVSDAVSAYYKRTWKEINDALTAVFAGRTPEVSCDRLYRGIEDLCRWQKADLVYGLLAKRCESYVKGEMRATLELEAAAAAGVSGAGSGSLGMNGTRGGGGVSSSDTEGGAYDVPTVRAVLARWKRWNEQTRVLRSVFSYLDRSYLLMQKDKPEINELAIELFNEMLKGDKYDKKDDTAAQEEKKRSMPLYRLLHGVCQLVDHDRRGDERFDSTLLRNAISMLHVLGIYQKKFEPWLLKDSHAFFKEFGEARSTSSLRDYISACKRLIEREDFRCIEYNLDSTTKRQIRDDAHEVLVMRYADRLLHAGDVARLLDEGDVESMAALYELLRLTGIQARLKAPWEEYIKATGSAIVEDAERGDEMVVRLLVLRKTLDGVVRDAFAKDAPQFTVSLRNAFGSFINAKTTSSAVMSAATGTSRIGERIAKHIDMLLRGGLKTLPPALLSDDRDKRDAEDRGIASTGDDDAELDRQLDHAVELFRFIEGRDVFEAFYKRDLARRLLMGRSANQDAERKVVAKFQNECGSSFTHNFEQMFKDQDISRDEMASYKQWLEGTGGGDGGRAKSGIDLNVSILSASAWPTYPDATVNLPPDVAREIERFEQYYQKKHTGRILSWKHGLAHCVVRAHFDSGTKELVMSAFQAIVLVLFNEVEQGRSIKKQSEESSGGTPGGFLSYSQIKDVTGLSDPDLQRTLQSLACGRARVLTKHPKGRDVSVTDTFTVNRAFTDARYRIKINQIQLQETKEENRQTHERVAQDRLFETQAAIVRVMKSRKTMTHAALVAEVINQTRKRGAVEPAEIKLNIEKYVPLFLV